MATGWCHCGWPQLSLCWGVFRQDVEEATQGCNSHGCVVGGAAVWGDRQRSCCESWGGGVRSRQPLLHCENFSDILLATLVSLDTPCRAGHPPASLRECWLLKSPLWEEMSSASWNLIWEVMSYLKDFLTRAGVTLCCDSCSRAPSWRPHPGPVLSTFPYAQDLHETF